SENWDNILDVNLKAPFFLSKGLSQKLNSSEGSIINIIDIHAERPLKKHSVYNISKAGLKMLTLTLAKELAPSIRVNGVSPGSILWPQEGAEISESDKSIMLERIALKRQGSPQDIADTVLFLANSNYLTGQIINVDGGRTLNQ
ncbi:SDR family oxidoreductase, partial [Candidatus Thioglobus sp.]|nr:SDR family oxidoreductase [Candidatus Thioglobus sp.]